MPKTPGPICQYLKPAIVDPGTLIRHPMLPPGPLLDYYSTDWIVDEEDDEPDTSVAEPVSELAGQSRNPWMDIAEGELGTKEKRGRKKHNPRILDYLKVVGQGADGDETAWCSAFANWCMQQAGLAGSGKATARSWLKWGVEAKETFGAITVLWRKKPDSWTGHVGFFVSGSRKHIQLLGGNQGKGGSVSIQAFPRSRLLGFRWPSGGGQT